MNRYIYSQSIRHNEQPRTIPNLRSWIGTRDNITKVQPENTEGNITKVQPENMEGKRGHITKAQPELQEFRRNQTPSNRKTPAKIIIPVGLTFFVTIVAVAGALIWFLVISPGYSKSDTQWVQKVTTLNY